MLLKIDTDNGEDWQEWSRKYDAEGNGIPIVYVVRADGEQLYAKSGSPDPLDQFLSQALSGAGKILSDRQLEKLAKDAAQARGLVEEENVAAAALIVSRVAGSGSFAEPAVDLDKLAAELDEKGREALQAAETAFKADGAGIEQALALVQVEREYGNLPSLKKEIGSTMSEFRREPALRDVLTQAGLLDRARTYEGDEKWRKAAAAYQSVVSRYAGTPAAQMAQEKIAELGDKVESVAATSPSEKSEEPNAADNPGSSDPLASQDGDEKKAAAQLRFGKALLKNNPSKARDYLEKAIEFAPESNAAKEARHLLKDL